MPPVLCENQPRDGSVSYRKDICRFANMVASASTRLRNGEIVEYDADWTAGATTVIFFLAGRAVCDVTADSQYLSNEVPVDRRSRFAGKRAPYHDF